MNNRISFFQPESRLAITLLLIGVFVGCNREHTIPPLDSTKIELTANVDGDTFHLANDGNVYREIEKGVSWEYHGTVFHPEEVSRSYTNENGQTYRIAPDTQKKFAVRNSFEESFEDLPSGVEGLVQLTKEDRNLWGSFTLQSPLAPSVADYVALRNQIVHDGANFMDGVIAPTSERAHSGKMSLRLVTPPKTEEMVTCKSSISSPLVYFRNQDDFWFEAFYWIDAEYPLTLVDLETEFVDQHPGIRLRLYEGGVLGAELKALHKPQYRQDEERAVVFPKKQWVGVRLHCKLSATDGQIEIFQDGQLVLDAMGPTLPYQSAIYNSLEVGISAYSQESGTSVIYLDDLRISSQRFEP